MAHIHVMVRTSFAICGSFFFYPVSGVYSIVCAFVCILKHMMMLSTGSINEPKYDFAYIRCENCVKNFHCRERAKNV